MSELAIVPGLPETTCSLSRRLAELLELSESEGTQGQLPDATREQATGLVEALRRRIVRKPDRDHRSLFDLDDRLIELTRTEFTLLQLLMSHAGYTFTRDELLEKIMGYAYEGMGRTLDTHISNLRKKIEPDPSAPTYIQTVYGVGYRMTRAG